MGVDDDRDDAAVATPLVTDDRSFCEVDFLAALLGWLGERSFLEEPEEDEEEVVDREVEDADDEEEDLQDFDRCFADVTKVVSDCDCDAEVSMRSDVLSLCGSLW